MLKSSGAMAVATMMSRVLGMVRVVLLAQFFGTSVVAGAFTFAFSIPNLFRRLLGEGALTAAFIPIFKEYEAMEGESAMWRVANVVISALMAVSVLIVLVVMVGLSLAIASDAFSDHFLLVMKLTRVMFPYMMMICLAAIFMGILNSRGQFFLPALAGTLLNLVLIPTILFVAPRWGVELDAQVFALGYGVLLAGCIQMFYMLPNLRREGFRFQWINPIGHPMVKAVWSRMLPGLLGVAAFQINVFLTSAIAAGVDLEILASWEYAVRLFELPQGVFGVSLATFLLPTLAGLAAEKKMPEFKQTLTRGLGYIIFINAVMGGFLLILAEPMIRLLFERGRFDAESTMRAASALRWLGLALVPYSVNSILSRAFFAVGDTRTPMRLSAVCLALNLVTTCLLIGPYQEAGLAISNCLTSVLNTFLLVFALRRKIGSSGFRGLIAMVLQVICVLAVSLSIGWFLHGWWLHRFGNETLVLRIGEVFVPLGLTGFSYMLFAFSLKMPVAREFFALVTRRLKRN